jgi:hypothetical protein
MHKRLTVNLVLLVVIVILAVVLARGGKDKGPISQARLSGIDPANISTIGVQRVGMDDLYFIRQEAAWYMQAPQDAAANPARINAMLMLLQMETHARLVTADRDLTPFKLDPPAVKLLLDQHMFSFGTVNPLDQRRYILFANSIHLVDDYLFHQLTQPASFFIQQ